MVNVADSLAIGGDATALGVTGNSLASTYEWAFQWGPGLVAGIGNGLILGYLMYRSELVPRRIEAIERIQGATTGLDDRLIELQVQGLGLNALDTKLAGLTAHLASAPSAKPSDASPSPAWVTASATAQFAGPAESAESSSFPTTVNDELVDLLV